MDLASYDQLQINFISSCINANRLKIKENKSPMVLQKKHSKCNFQKSYFIDNIIAEMHKIWHSSSYLSEANYH